MQRKSVVGVKLDEETKGRLQALGEARQRSTHWLMHEAILRYLEEEEEAERRNLEADQAWERFQTTGEHHAHEEVKAWLSSWGAPEESPPPERPRAAPR
jgi:predicted transcriptional regulator